MRLFKYAAVATCVVLAVAYLAFLLLSPQDPGSIDRAAVKHIHALCGLRTDCEVTFRDIAKGDWDNFYEFGYSVSQAKVNQVLKTRSVGVSDLQRVLVFVKDGKIVRKSYGDTGQGQPLANQIEFSGTYQDGWIKFSADTRFKVLTCDTKEGGNFGGPYGGTYYLLVPLPIRPGYLTQCDLPFG